MAKDKNRDIRTKLVSDPYNPGRLVEVPINVRENAVDLLVANGWIDGDGAHVAAANRFQRLYEAVRIGPVRGRDPATVSRSDGAVPDPISEKVFAAGRELAAIAKVIGMRQMRMLELMIGEGLGIGAAANLWARAGIAAKRAEGYVVGTLQDALDALISHWGMIGSGRSRKGAVRASNGLSITGPSYEVSVGRFGDTEIREIVPERTDT